MAQARGITLPDNVGYGTPGVALDLTYEEASLVLGALEVERDAHMEMLADPALENREATKADLKSYEHLMAVLKEYLQ